MAAQHDASIGNSNPNELRAFAVEQHRGPSIADEVFEVAADESDREEMRIIREQMAELAPEPPDD